AFGSRGDIQPFLALAVALRERGHNVTLAAPSDYEAQITAYNISYVRIPITNMEFGQQDNSTSAGVKSPSPIALLRKVLPALNLAFYVTAQVVAEASQNADLLISHGFLVPFAYSIHQHLKIPLMLGIAAPIISTKMFPSPMFPPIPFGQQLYNPLTYDW